MEKNYYIENVKEIAIVSYKEDVDWSVAVDIYDNEKGLPYGGASGQISDARHEFYEFVKGRAYDAEGNEVTDEIK